MPTFYYCDMVQHPDEDLLTNSSQNLLQIYQVKSVSSRTRGWADQVSVKNDASSALWKTLGGISK